MNTTEVKVYDLVCQYFFKNRGILEPNISITEISHIFDMGKTILLHKWGLVNYKAGGFVTAFLNNDLEGTFAKADNTNVKAVYFYLRLCNNIDCPKDLIVKSAEK